MVVWNYGDTLPNLELSMMSLGFARIRIYLSN